MGSKKISTIFQNADFLVVDKEAGIDVEELRKETGYQPAHRLDKDTSGLIILAKNDNSLLQLQKLFQERKVTKKYLGLVIGDIKNRGEVKLEIARDPKRKQPMKIIPFVIGAERGKLRLTKTAWQTMKEYNYKNEILSLVEFQIYTGRTHQIRVTCQYLGHPLVGDNVYGNKISKKISRELGIERQFLHSAKLGFEYGGKKFAFESKLPIELENTLQSIDK